jgi:hypothetical protein
VKYELFEKLKRFSVIYPDKFDTLTEKEFCSMTESKRREEHGAYGNGVVCCKHIVALHI